MNDPAASCEVSKNKKQIATDLSADRQVHRFNRIKNLICESVAINISFPPQLSCEEFFRLKPMRDAGYV